MSKPGNGASGSTPDPAGSARPIRRHPQSRSHGRIHDGHLGTRVDIDRIQPASLVEAKGWFTRITVRKATGQLEGPIHWGQGEPICREIECRVRP